MDPPRIKLCRVKLNLERLTVRLGLTVIYFIQYFVRHGLTSSGYEEEEVRACLTKYWIKYITVNPNRMVSLSKFSFSQAFAFADQILPGSGTFDLSVGPFSLSKV